MSPVENLVIKNLLDEAREAVATADSRIKQVERILSGDEEIQRGVVRVA